MTKIQNSKQKNFKHFDLGFENTSLLKVYVTMGGYYGRVLSAKKLL